MTGMYYLQGIKRKGGSRMGFVRIDDSTFTGSYYYFNEEEGAGQGQMMIGRQTVEGGGAETNHYHFKDNGQAYWDTIADGFLYGSDGLRIESDSDAPMLVDVSGGLVVSEKGSGRKYKDCTFIVSPSGKLKKSGTVKIDGYKYTVRNYKVIKAEED